LAFSFLYFTAGLKTTAELLSFNEHPTELVEHILLFRLQTPAEHPALMTSCEAD
jgi:hypothetical protein